MRPVKLNTMEENRLIAEFMGYSQPHPEYPNTTYWYKEGEAPRTVLLYNTDWNWLMEVVHKIESIEVIGEVFNIQIDRNKTHILYAPANYPSEKWFENLIIKESEDKLLNTYQSIIEFIKWYNEQN
jgi:hypothetical protein